MASWFHADIACYEVVRHPWVYLVAIHRFTRIAMGAKRFDCWLYRDLCEELGGELVAKFIDQVRVASKAVRGEVSLRDEAFAADYPAVFEFCSELKNSDGSNRQTATLLAFVEAGCWKFCLGDRESGLSLWAAGETFVEALECLEGLLTGGNPQWRQGTKRTTKKP